RRCLAPSTDAAHRGRGTAIPRNGQAQTRPAGARSITGCCTAHRADRRRVAAMPRTRPPGSGSVPRPGTTHRERGEAQRREQGAGCAVCSHGRAAARGPRDAGAWWPARSTPPPPPRPAAPAPGSRVRAGIGNEAVARGEPPRVDLADELLARRIEDPLRGLSERSDGIHGGGRVGRVAEPERVPELVGD